MVIPCVYSYVSLQLMAVVPPEVVLELGGGPHSPWMAPEKRHVLADMLAQILRIKVGISFAC